jgi:hypothetical protein
LRRKDAVFLKYTARKPLADRGNMLAGQRQIPMLTTNAL